MTTLQSITLQYKEDLERLNTLITTHLSSVNPLMSKIVTSLLRTKGKQLRPLLLMMCAKAFGAIDEKVLSAAVAVELLHNASLIHDDVVDNSPTRRSHPTVNAIWDNHVAVLVGDFFTSSAMQAAISTGDIRIIEELCGLGRDLSLGEIDQINNARCHHLDKDAYYHIIDYKTASLFVAASRMGCHAANASAEATDALSNYALLFGRCFQLRDDVFDYFSSDIIGKPTGNDLREGKVSLPLLLALENKGHGYEEIIALLEHDSLSDAEIEHIQAYARDNGGIDATYDVMNDLRRQAVEKLQVLPNDEIRQQLTALFDFVIERQY